MTEFNFLKTTRENEEHLEKSSFVKNDIRFDILDTGIIKATPKLSSRKDAFIISCGIHGNETAPIEFTNEILNKLVAGSLNLVAPTLFIFGNPKAMNIGKRFSEYNLNRCFNGAYKDLDEYYEKSRAEVIEKVCFDFYKEVKEKDLFHFDLHCALKKSMIERFALVPKNEERRRDDEFNLILANMGIEASLFSHKESTVFSSFSFTNFNAFSATVELGKVYPFGQNPPGKFQAAQETIEKLLSGHELEKKKAPKAFTIFESINKEFEDFKFTFEEEESANFTPFKKGEHIFTQNAQPYLCPEENLRMIFPNSKVILGQRALLLIKELE
ncbi:succinylglutamate desuccinylase [Halobacteriovorax sp.]|uniref:succinylglutamate desuccinylase n=1 Tax=Halobacteriovorax sp. TaxID=2020862 RepID=UPI003AF2926B